MISILSPSVRIEVSGAIMANYRVWRGLQREKTGGDWDESDENVTCAKIAVVQSHGGIALRPQPLKPFSAIPLLTATSFPRAGNLNTQPYPSCRSLFSFHPTLFAHCHHCIRPDHITNVDYTHNGAPDQGPCQCLLTAELEAQCAGADPLLHVRFETYRLGAPLLTTVHGAAPLSSSPVTSPKSSILRRSWRT